jgi:PD-(D/E)XK nuclease superfamily
MPEALMADGLSLASPVRISPSLLRVSRLCRLRALLLVGGETHRLPQTPAAAVGTVAHNMLERAQRGEAGTPPEPGALRKIWSEELSIVERDCRSDTRRPLDACIIPLSESYRLLERRRLSAVRTARSCEVYVRGGTGQPPTERTVTSRDGTVGGRIDRLVIREDEFVVRDFKAGKVFDADGRLRQSHVDQLHLYAAVISDDPQFSRWPTKLELVDGRGVVHEIPLDQNYAAVLFELARTEQRVLREELVALRMGERTVAAVAAPGAASCDGCPFRPVCPAWRHWLSMNSAVAYESGLTDLVGKLRSWYSAGPELSVVELTDGRVIQAVGDPHKDPRAADLAETRTGDDLLLLNVRAARKRRGVHSATPTTIVLHVRSDANPARLSLDPPIDGPR